MKWTKVLARDPEIVVAGFRYVSGLIQPGYAAVTWYHRFDFHDQDCFDSVVGSLPLHFSMMELLHFEVSRSGHASPHLCILAPRVSDINRESRIESSMS